VGLPPNQSWPGPQVTPETDVEVQPKDADPGRKEPWWLLDHVANTHSQYGEDGIIREILRTIGGLDRWCVEFGAWNGRYLSNTRRLIEEDDYAAVLIEGNLERYRELRSLAQHGSNEIHIHQWVGFGTEDGLDSILARTPVPKHFDLLSIDIDGNDYHVWEALRCYRPKVVCIEYNHTIPTEVDFVQEKDAQANHGSSVAALTRLGAEKDYHLVCITKANALFVRSEFFPRFGISTNSPGLLRRDQSDITYLFFGYDGTVFLRGRCELPWHGLPLNERDFQTLPRWLRGVSETRSMAGRLALKAMRALRSPDGLIKTIATGLGIRRSPDRRY